MPCVSAINGNLDELVQLLVAIQSEKRKIVEHVFEQKLKPIVSSMIALLDEQLQTTSNENEATAHLAFLRTIDFPPLNLGEITYNLSYDSIADTINAVK